MSSYNKREAQYDTANIYMYIVYLIIFEVNLLDLYRTTETL